MWLPESSQFAPEAFLEYFKSEVEISILSGAPLVPEGRKIVVDERVLKNLLSTNIADFFPSMPLEEREELKGNLLKQFNRVAGSLPFDASELYEEAAETKRTLLMAAPEKLGDITVEQKMQVFKQWFCIRHALVKAGAHLDIMPTSPNEGGSREVYTRDRYVIIGNTAYLPDPKILWLVLPLHRGFCDLRDDLTRELSQIEKALRVRGVNTVVVDGAWFEGGNVVRHFRSQTLFVGIHDPKFSEDSAQKLLSAINRTEGEKWSLLPVPLTNHSKMYHLDTGMSEELPNGEVMISPLVTGKETYQKICDIIGAKNVIVLSNDEAKHLATNTIDVGDTLVMTGNYDDLCMKLTARGYTVIMPDDYGQDSFEFGKGGVHCMTNDLPQPRRQQKAPCGP